MRKGLYKVVCFVCEKLVTGNADQLFYFTQSKTYALLILKINQSKT